MSDNRAPIPFVRFCSAPGRACFFAILTLVVSLAGVPARAASFGVSQYSIRDMGSANAGYAALAEDASTVFSNPAGLVHLSTRELVAGFVNLRPRTRFEPPSGSPGAHGNFGDNELVPHLYLAYPLGRRLAVGLGVSVPFGLTIEYGQGWLGRYQAIASAIETVDINPALGFRLTDAVSLGFGFSLQRAKVTMSSAIDFGALCVGLIDPVAPGTCAATGVLPGAADGLGTTQGTDWSIGWNVGVLFRLGEKTRLGVHHRSLVAHALEGQGTFAAPATAAALLPFLGGAFVDSRIAANVDLPATLSGSVFHDLTDRIAIMTSVQRTFWSSLEEVRVRFANPAQPDLVETLNFRDTMRVAVGTRVKLTDTVSLRTGFSYDQTPVRRAFATARLPDGNRKIGALGLDWSPQPDLTITLAVDHAAFKALPIDKVGAFGDRLTGTFKASMTTFGLAAQWRFGS